MKHVANSIQTAERSSVEELAARAGKTAEHVVLSGFGDEHLETERSNVVRQRIELRNPIRRTRIELCIFKDNFISVGEYRGNRRLPKREIDLRYLDPGPKLSRYIAKKTARLVLICAASAAFWTALALLGAWPAITGALTFASLAAACTAAIRYALRTRDTVEFQTSHGRTVVISLVANIGSMHAYRTAVPKIVAAIRHANSKADTDRTARLRAEIREHYRLARAGVISKRNCEQATRQILGDF